MDAIFHERQEGSLCAQHCLNSLLQGPYFSAVDLADIGRDLDEAERATMAEGDINSPEYLRFIQQPSSNMDDSGYFSVQVIGRALKVWGLELLPFGSTEAVEANIHPEREKAFICNFKDHWLVIRKLGRQWFNLNSLLTGPELISDTYLGYSLFVVRGMLPDNEADQLLNLVPAVQTQKPRLLGDVNQQQQARSTSTAGAGPSGKRVVSLKDLHNALQASQSSLSEGSGGERLGGIQEGANSQELVDAIKLSMQVNDGSVAQKVDVEDLRKRRQAFFDRQQTPGTQQPPEPVASAVQHTSPLGMPNDTSSTTHPQAMAGQSSDTPKVSLPPSLEQTNYQESDAIRQSHEMQVENYANDEQMTEEAMLEIAIQMSLNGTQKQGSTTETQQQQQHESGS